MFGSTGKSLKSSDSSQKSVKQCSNIHGFHDYGKIEAEVDSPPVMFVSAFETKASRQAFVRKVFGILTIMLAVVTGMASIVIFVQPLRNFLNEHWWISLIAWIPFLIVYFVLVCIPTLRKRYPVNIGFLALLTLTMGVVLMGACAHTEPEIVVLTFGVTAVTCIAIIIAASSKICCDITTWGFILFAALFAAMMFTIFAVIINLFVSTSIVNTLVCGIFVAIFMGFLAFDTQQIVGGRRIQMNPDEYVLGAMQLFLDIVMIFMYMLGIARN